MFFLGELSPRTHLRKKKKPQNNKINHATCLLPNSENSQKQMNPRSKLKVTLLFYWAEHFFKRKILNKSYDFKLAWKKKESCKNSFGAQEACIT